MHLNSLLRNFNPFDLFPFPFQTKHSPTRPVYTKWVEITTPITFYIMQIRAQYKI
ncbi:hypothetical protein HanRHA438_Chr10g0434271 [Helianthus annuus]|nr:hypothetical protein HanRHA438_Chr10g0434271 [Helianthus annuus]